MAARVKTAITAVALSLAPCCITSPDPCASAVARHRESQARSLAAVTAYGPCIAEAPAPMHARSAACLKALGELEETNAQNDRTWQAWIECRRKQDGL